MTHDPDALKELEEKMAPIQAELKEDARKWRLRLIKEKRIDPDFCPEEGRSDTQLFVHPVWTALQDEPDPNLRTHPDIRHLDRESPLHPGNSAIFCNGQYVWSHALVADSGWRLLFGELRGFGDPYPEAGTSFGFDITATGKEFINLTKQQTAEVALALFDLVGLKVTIERRKDKQ